LLLHVLSPGFTSPNGRAFLFPLIAYRRALAEEGISLRLFRTAGPELADCDVLLVDRKAHEPLWPTRGDAILAEFARWAERTRVVFCDTSDSAGWLHAALLPIVHVYAKGQLLRDRTAYGTPHYGFRAFADYYHRTLGIEDEQPAWSEPVGDVTLLSKLRVAWNTGLADYSLFGPFRMALFERMPLPILLNFPRDFVPPSSDRPHAVSCRFGTAYARDTVAVQRRLISERMAGRMQTAKIPRRRYIAELRQSKVVVSPFGWGEITLKDFEVFLTGGLLFKPDMSGIETWPDLFADGVTCVTHRWDLDDFETVLDGILADYRHFLPLAEEGQARYARHLSGPGAASLFVAQLRSLFV